MAFKPKFLILDDDEDSLICLKELLEKAYKANVLTASTGKETLDQLKKNPDTLAILMDVYLGEGKTSIETFEKIRKSKKTKHIPIIFNTGEPSVPAELAEYLAQGEIFYILKTNLFDSNRLETIIEEACPIFGSSDTIQLSIINLFGKYMKERMDLDPEQELTTNLDSDKRFLLHKTRPTGGGKYGKVSFLGLTDGVDNSTQKFVVKRNRGMFNGDNPYLVTTIEAKILRCLREEFNLPVVESYVNQNNILMTRYLDGTTVEEFIRNNPVVPPKIVISMIETMPKFHYALSQMIEGGVGDLTNEEIEFLRQRTLNTVRSNFQTTDRDQIERNYYTYRIFQAFGVEDILFFLDEYSKINDILMNASKTWLGYGHPRNRIVMQMHKKSPIEVIAYDFNHLSKDFFGLDLAMLLSTLTPDKLDQEPQQDIFGLSRVQWAMLKPENLKKINPRKLSQQDKFIISVGNYMNLALLSEFYENNKGSLSQEDASEVTGAIKRLKSPKQISYRIEDIRPFYKHDKILLNQMSLYASFMHRSVLDLIKVVQNDGSRAEEQAQTYTHFLKLIETFGRFFYRDLNRKQKRILQNEGIFKPLSCESLSPLEHTSIRPYIQQLL